MTFPWISYANAAAVRGEQKWVASWGTAIAGPYKGMESVAGTSPLILMFAKQSGSDSEFALPDGEAVDQTFRMIVRPDKWGQTVRVRFSNVFGDRELSLGAATVGLQEYAGHLVPGTNTPLTFRGSRGVSIPRGGQIVSDPVRLSYVTGARSLGLWAEILRSASM